MIEFQRSIRLPYLQVSSYFRNFSSKQFLVSTSGVTLSVVLITIEMKDFDVILKQNNLMIDCYHQRVTFKLVGGNKFSYKGRPLLNHKMIITAMQAWKLLVNGCVKYSVTTVDRSKEVKISPTQVPVCGKLLKSFLRTYRAYHQSERSLLRQNSYLRRDLSPRPHIGWPQRN